MLVGYARSSTSGQVAGLEDQISALVATGCTEPDAIFHEYVSSTAIRDKLREALAFVRCGDTLCVTRIDRLARSVSDLLHIISLLEAKNVGLRVLDFGGSQIDTASPSGRLTLTMLGAMAEFEKALLRDRQRAGIEKAKRDGKYRGRAPTARRKIADVRKLSAEGVGAAQIAHQTGMSRSSVYRLLGEGA